jgi:hypothetical protein
VRLSELVAQPQREEAIRSTVQRTRTSRIFVERSTDRDVRTAVVSLCLEGPGLEYRVTQQLPPPRLNLSISGLALRRC